MTFELLHVSLLPLAFQEFRPRSKEIIYGNDILVGKTALSSYTAWPTPPPKLLPVLERLKAAYILWHQYYQTLPKTHRYTLGLRLDGLLVECLEATASATFLDSTEKEPWIRLALRKLDTLKILLLVLWETGSLETKKYAALSVPLEDAGRQLGGWHGQVARQNERPQGGRSK